MVSRCGIGTDRYYARYRDDMVIVLHILAYYKQPSSDAVRLSFISCHKSTVGRSGVKDGDRLVIGARWVAAMLSNYKHLRLCAASSFYLANVNSRSRSLYAIARLSVCLSVTFVRPTQAVQIFGNISTALGTLAIH